MATQCHRKHGLGKDHVFCLSITKNYARAFPWQQSGEVRIFHAAFGVVLEVDEQVSPSGVAVIAVVAAGFPAAMTEFHQHFAVGPAWAGFETEFLSGADPVRRVAVLAFPAHERWRRQLLDAHL